MERLSLSLTISDAMTFPKPEHSCSAIDVLAFFGEGLICDSLGHKTKALDHLNTCAAGLGLKPFPLPCLVKKWERWWLS